MKDHHKKESPIITLPSLAGGFKGGLPPDGDPWYAQYSVSSSNNFDDFASAIDLDSSRNVFITTTSYQYSTSGTKYAYLVKFDNDGAHQWTSRITGLEVMGMTSIATSDTDVFLSGSWYNSNGYLEGYIGKWNESGTLQWHKQFYAGNNISTRFRDVTTDPSGNVYVVGWINTTPESLLTFKYNSSGTLQWVKRFVSISGDNNANVSGQSITYVPAGGGYPAGVVVTGEVVRYESDSDGNVYTHDLFAIRYDVNGNVRWKKGVGDGWYYMKANGSQWGFAPQSEYQCTKNLVSDSSGNIYFGGMYGSGYNSVQSLIVKLADDGSLSWVRKIGNTARTVMTTGLSVSSDGTNLFQTYIYLDSASNSTAQGHITQVLTSTGVGVGGTANVRSSIFYKDTGITWEGTTQGSSYLRGVHTDSRGRIYVLGEGYNFLRANSGRETAIWKLDPELINGVYDSGDYSYKYYFTTNSYPNQDPRTHNVASPAFTSRNLDGTNSNYTGYTDSSSSRSVTSHSPTTTTISWNPGNP